MTTTQWRAPARLCLSGPTGWAPVERIDVHHRDGDARVTVESWPVGAHGDLDELALAHLAQRLPRRGTLVEAEVLGARGGRRCTTSTTDDLGHRLEVSVDYALRDGWMVAVTEVRPADDAAKAREVAGIAASVRVIAPGQVDAELLPLRPSSSPGWGAVREAWGRGRPVPALEEHVLTTEETFGAARHFGVAMLPGADTTAWNRLDDAQRELVAGVTWTSLLARGGDAGAAGGLRDALEVAASHDALLLVSGEGPHGIWTQWYALRPDLAARVRHGEAPGTVRLGLLETATVASTITDQPAVPGSRVSASCVYRSAGRVVGEETTWHPDAPAAEAHEALARLLPGSQTDEER